MLNTTKDAIRAVCRADPTMTEQETQALNAFLSGHFGKGKERENTVPLVCTFDEAAEMLRVGRGRIKQLIAGGYLRGLAYGPKGERTRFLLLESVRAFIDGAAQRSMRHDDE